MRRSPWTGRPWAGPEAVGEAREAVGEAAARVAVMATAPTEPLSQRLAAIRDQLKLLADYL